MVLGATALLLATIGGAFAGAQAHASMAGDCARDGSVTTGAVFNNPHTSDDDRIHRHMACLIDGAPEGADVQLATYHLQDRDIVSSLVTAHERGVHVRIVVDGKVPVDDRDGVAYERLRALLGGDREADSFIAPCPGDADRDRACIADRKMHNKILTVSESHGVPDVTFVTTSNLQDWSGNSGTDMWNSGYTAADDPALHGWFADTYFTDLSAASPEDLDYYEAAGLPREIGNYHVFHSPRRNGNTALDVLEKVECHGNTSGGTDPGHRTIVRVAMWSISSTGGVGTAIAKRLWDLDNEGCYVDVVADGLDYTPEKSTDPLRTLLRKPERTEAGGGVNYHGPEVREFNSKQPHGLHEKNLIIDGNYDGEPNQKIVFTGSLNFTQASAGNTSSHKVNDETWLQIEDDGVHDRFAENFADVRAAAHTCWQTSKEQGCGGGRSPDAPDSELNCHETADKYAGAGYVYLYDGTYCAGSNDDRDNSPADRDHGDNAGQVQGFDNETDSLVNTTSHHIEFYNYRAYNSGHDEGDSFCVRPGQWVNQLSRYGDGHNSWSSSMSSHRVVDPSDCDRWFGGYHEPHR